MANPSQTVTRHTGRHVFQTLAARKFEGNIGSPYQGNTFYVDGNAGSDGNNGRYASAPLATITAAIALCTDAHDDYIFIMDCWQEGATIDISKSNIHLIAMSHPYATWVCLNVATDIDIMQVSSGGHNAEIAGFVFGGGLTAAGIYLMDSLGVWIHHNTFGHAYAGDTPLYGIESYTYGNPAACLIEDNIFMGDGASDGKISSNGIYINQGGSSSFTNSIIRRNTFMGLIGASLAGAILLDQVAGVQVLDNYFLTTDYANGDAINILATSAGCLVMRNHAAKGFLSNGYTYNPFRDLNANTSNAWGLNYQGNAIVEPVGV